MPGKNIWKIRNVFIAVFFTLFAFSAISYFWNFEIFILELTASVLVFIVGLFRYLRFRHDIYSILLKTAQSLDVANRQTLLSFPLPAVVTGERGEVLWYNDKFREMVMEGKDDFGFSLQEFVPDLDMTEVESGGIKSNIELKNRRYTVYGNKLKNGLSAFYWIDDTDLKKTYEEYQESRPAVAIVMIDNYDELVQNAKEGEKSEIISMVEKTLVKWVSKTTGFLRHSDRDKYILVIEERHLRAIVQNRFDILDSIRQIVNNDRMPATLSIGVGRYGGSLAENEEMARQALDMALGRGGDQAAIKTKNGFEFYGGVSKAVEKRTKVKTRIIASALTELIDGSDNVLIMGHKNSDLDVVGSSASLYRAVLARGKACRVVLDKKNSLAGPLIKRLEANGYQDAFIEPEDASQMVTRRSMLIVVDAHRKSLVEYPELLKMVKTVVIIDHHRKMVDFIDNAVIFYHEPFSSSTCEMVSELIQYIADQVVTHVEADAMLAGITLDTRNFTVRTGVRTFEAAAYLKRKGADTASVRLLFAGSIENFNKRYQIVTDARIYKNCAISVYNGALDENLRVVAPQAADELLTINGVSASFVLYPVGDKVAVSARSMGKVNVQLIMESLGGGGHQTMAGVQLPGISLAGAKEKICAAIDQYFSVNK